MILNYYGEISKIRIYFLFILILSGFSQNIFAQSLSDIDIVVKETVINSYPYNPFTGELLTFAHIGYLELEQNDNPTKCIATVYGLIMETELPKANPVANFLVCVYKDLNGELMGRVIEKYNRF